MKRDDYEKGHNDGWTQCFKCFKRQEDKARQEVEHLGKEIEKRDTEIGMLKVALQSLADLCKHTLEENNRLAEENDYLRDHRADEDQR